MLQPTQILKLKMYSEILELCEANEKEINFSPDFNVSLSVFKMKIAGINEMIALGLLAKKKYDDRNDILKRRLCNVASEMKAMLNGEFTSFSQQALKVNIAECFTELYISEDKILKLKVDKIYQESHSRINDLLKFGVTAPLIEVLKDMLAEYEDATYKKNYMAVNKTITFNIKNLFMEAEYVLRKQLDRYINRIRRRNLTFIVEYRKTRYLKCESTQVA